jgi:hypothetical protein
MKLKKLKKMMKKRSGSTRVKWLTLNHKPNWNNLIKKVKKEEA